LLGVVFIAIFGYVTREVLVLTSEPELRITTPEESQVFLTQEIEIAGSTNPNHDIYINNTQIEVSGVGDFSEWIILSPGVQEIQIEARNRLGRVNRETRTVIIESFERDTDGERSDISD